MVTAQVLLTSLFAPFILWPIEQFIPYPHFVEELAKAFILLPLLSSKLSNKERIVVALIGGVGFAATESVFYLYNIFLVGSFQTYLLRILLTVPLHGLTYLIILIPGLIDKRLIVVGLFIAILVHYIFNQVVLSI